MILSIDSELDIPLTKRAQSLGLSPQAYVEKLIRLDLPSTAYEGMEAEGGDAEYEEIRTAVI